MRHHVHRVMVLAAGAAGVGLAAQAGAQTFIGSPTQEHGWSTTSAVSIVAHSGEADGRVFQDTINGAGLDFETGLLHSNGIPFGIGGMGRNDGATAWGPATTQHGGTVEGSHWIEFAFDRDYNLGNMYFWNWNEGPWTVFGLKHVTIQTSLTDSTNATDWTTVFDGIVPKATGADQSPATAVIDLGGSTGVLARYVMLTAETGLNRNWSNGSFADAGFYEVRFAEFNPAAQVGWKNDASGDWNNAANWKEGTPPNGSGTKALFGPVNSLPRTVYTDVPVSVSTLQFDSVHSYQITGQGSLSMVVTSGAAVVDVLQGSHKINLPFDLPNDTNLNVGTNCALTISNPIDLSGGVTLTKNGAGTLTVITTMNAPSAATVKVNGGVANFAVVNNDPDITLNIDPATVNLSASQTFGPMVLSLGGNVLNVGQDLAGNNVSAKLTVDSMLVATGGPANIINTTLAGNTVRVNNSLSIRADSKLVKQGPGVLVAGSLSINSTGQLDLTTSKSIVDYTGTSPIATLMEHLQAGRIASSSATSATGIGYGEAAVLGLSSFGGEPVDSTAVVMKYTYFGDTNLDGQVDVIDLGNFATAWQTGGLWTNGDSNYDGFVDVIDLGLLATNWQAGVGSPLGPGSLDAELAAFGLPNVSVPEPAMLGLAALAGMAIRRRRS